MSTRVKFNSKPMTKSNTNKETHYVYSAHKMLNGTAILKFISFHTVH